MHHKSAMLGTKKKGSKSHRGQSLWNILKEILKIRGRFILMLDNVLHSGVLWVLCLSLAEGRGSCSGARGQGEGGLQKLWKFPRDVRIQIIS